MRCGKGLAWYIKDKKPKGCKWSASSASKSFYLFLMCRKIWIVTYGIFKYIWKNIYNQEVWYLQFCMTVMNMIVMCMIILWQHWNQWYDIIWYVSRCMTAIWQCMTMILVWPWQWENKIQTHHYKALSLSMFTWYGDTGIPGFEESDTGTVTPEQDTSGIRYVIYYFIKKCIYFKIYIYILKIRYFLHKFILNSLI